MKLRHSAGSPFVRKATVVAHEHGLVGSIELLPTTVSPVSRFWNGAVDGAAPAGARGWDAMR